MIQRPPYRDSIAAAAVLLAGLCLSACGPKPSESPQPADKPAATPATTTARSAPADKTAAASAPETAAAAATTAPAAAKLATLTVKVTDLRDHKGQLIFGVFKSADGFPTEPGKSVNWQVKDADADAVTFTTSLPPGDYGASVLHDENRNGKMDRNFAGVPLEGYGVTNNPKPALRAATFKEATFTLPPEGATLTISIQYF